FPLQKFARPALPALGHLRNRKQAIHFMAIAGIDAEYVANRETVIGALDDPDVVAGAHVTLGDEAQIRPGSQRFGEAARKQRIVHPNAEPPARDSWLGNLDNCGSDLPTLTDDRVVHLDPFCREVFAKLAISERSTDLMLPPPRVFDRECVDHLVGSPVRISIRLLVSLEVDAANGDPAGGRRFPDAAPGRTTLVLERPSSADVDREHPPRPSAPFPKFVIHRGILSHELRKQRGTSKHMIPVPLSI